MECFKDGVNSEKFGKRLKAARRSRGISSELLSELVGKSSGGYIRMIEAAQNGISLDALVDVCNALDVSPELLLVDSLHLDYEHFHEMSLLTPSQKRVIQLIIHAMTEENKNSEGNEA